MKAGMHGHAVTDVEYMESCDQV